MTELWWCSNSRRPEKKRNNDYFKYPYPGGWRTLLIGCQLNSSLPPLLTASILTQYLPLSIEKCTPFQPLGFRKASSILDSRDGSNCSKGNPNSFADRCSNPGLSYQDLGNNSGMDSWGVRGHSLGVSWSFLVLLWWSLEESLKAPLDLGDGDVKPAPAITTFATVSDVICSVKPTHWLGITKGIP